MRVIDTFQIKGKGCVALVVLEAREVFIGTVLRRRSDQHEITVRGIEKHAIVRAPREGDIAGLLVSPAVNKGDELEHIT